MEAILKHKLSVTTVIITLLSAVVVFTVLKYKRRIRKASEALHYMNISIVTNEETCNSAVTIIRRKCAYQNAIGFDCEWVTVGRKRQPVALLQLSTLDGFCGLFRLNQMKTVPSSLKALLEDNTIYKVGVSPSDDAKYLFHDWGPKLKSSLDVRHLARACGYSAGGLASLSEALLQITLDKHWKVRCSDWEAEQLTDRQIVYAAADAHVAIKIFAKLIREFTSRARGFYWHTGKMGKDSQQDVNDLCRDIADVAFKTKHNSNQKTNGKKDKIVKKEDIVISKRYPYLTRTKPLYNNCYLQAPDGELLCTCDKKKALWYVEKELGAVVSEAPLTVRLRFEPAGRSVGAVGRYYQLAKENKCVVCGSTDSYIRKNVVPREYRKYFPEVMKDHSSHDVVLLCVRCHQLSNTLDLRMREMLARKCHAPLASGKAEHSCDFNTRKIRSLARALLYQSQSLPEARRRKLEEVLLHHYPQCEVITQELLQEAAATSPEVAIKKEEESHGMKVVEYHLKHEGLLRLEEYWREHFLTSMEPKCMPELWSIKHNEERLRVRFEEGRLSQKDLQSIGLASWI
ncbi:exonuclease 3'-5' domain-containing protein 2 isoform X1 [Cydia pomonella]|uniref:exonuclease 3'-5' domain-containing protein 2 isoform X1 n=2 Tax=Cydia pomonella TaxID=82600 RepID=UPI002ADDB671|nr:exonuclease 3'-5' domain-containing protein 2 isoform X1 [Cydia pomonella]